jgi:serine/threonine protein kinase
MSRLLATSPDVPPQDVSPMNGRDLDELLDQLVSQYADRVANGRGGETADLLQQVPPERRAALQRSFSLVELGSAPQVAPRPVLPGTVIGGCRVLSTLGRGGVATVFRAEQLALQREVAVKVLRPGLAIDPRQVERFRREGLAVARLEHPNIVKIHDVGAQDGHLFLVMERVDGADLAQALERLPAALRRTGADFERALRGTAAADAAAPPAGDESPATYERAVARFFATVARAVQAAHEHGVIHRDLKPSNVLLRRDGTPVVADFGLAKGDHDLAMSLTGEPIGTPYYMSPEQIEQISAQVDARTDVWSLGVTLYEALTGQRPFRGETAIAVFDAIRREFPPSVRTLNPNLTRECEAVVARALAREPGERYATAAELAADLDALAAGAPTRARRHRPRHAALHAALQQLHHRQSFEYRSPRTLLGLPLLHVCFGVRRIVSRRSGVTLVFGVGHLGRREVGRARGWLAIGDVAEGVIAIGSFAKGGIAIGAVTLGVVSVGGLAFGGLALGGVAAGLVALGGVAAGITAIGGFALGHYAQGGKALGDHVLSADRRDPEAIEFFGRHGRNVFSLSWAMVRGAVAALLGR